MTAVYVELHAKSFYSFGTGAAHTHELLAQAQQYGYHALALTDTNLCGALEFARQANTMELQPITGGELTLTDDTRLTLLARSRRGYAHLSQLFTRANARDRQEPRLDPVHLPAYAEDMILLTGGRQSRLSLLAQQEQTGAARRLLREYRDWFGPDGVYVELQQNFAQGDTERNRALYQLARLEGVPVVATNDVHYHQAERFRLQNVLAAAKRNTTLDQALRYITPNPHLCLKTPAQMARLFRHCPEAIANTVRIAQQCQFNLDVNLNYMLPAPELAPGDTPIQFLQRLCYKAAQYRYGAITPQVESRLQEEFHLIEHHDLAGFLLLYREIVQIAHTIMEEKGMVHPDTPRAERLPGRGRGSSVALLAGYLIGISHVDPLKWGLTLERFIAEDTNQLPDIDLDFPRGLRDELILRVHEHFGREFAVLTGAIMTYTAKGIIQDLGKALGLPREELTHLSKQLSSRDGHHLREEMLAMVAFRDRVEAPGWRELVQLAPQLMGAPKLLSQHVGGLILSSSPISEMVPIRAGAIPGRYIMDWNKDSVADANFAKIDLLSLPVLDQLEEALNLVQARCGHRPDLTQIDPDDPAVYDLINEGRSKGVFLLQSPAQLKLGQRLLSRNLLDLAYQVALIRPGVGMQGSAVSQFVERYRHNVEWDYDHPLEKRALERGYGIIVWQEQVVQLLMDVGDMTAAQADEVRRAFSRRNNSHLIAAHKERFMVGALRQGVSQEIALKIFDKINGHYMFPESHSHAFGITAYQAAWLKCYYPLEFFVALINNQPMGFYPMETLKQDARRFGVPFRNPCVNRSEVQCVPEAGGVRLGLKLIKDVGPAASQQIVMERDLHGAYTSPSDLVRRTGLESQALLSLVQAGAFDATHPNRRVGLWDAGLTPQPGRKGQVALALQSDRGAPPLSDFTDWEKMAGEYSVMGLYPKGHLMEFMRPRFSKSVLKAPEVEAVPEGETVMVAGWPIARQHPRGRAGTVFVTLEDEAGDIQILLWPQVFERCRQALRSQVILAKGVISRWDGTTTIITSDVRAVATQVQMPGAHDWH